MRVERDLTEKDLFTYTNVVICGELMSNYIDDLKETRLYKQGLKNSCNGAQKEIEGMLKKELPRMYEADEMFLNNLMIDFKKLVENITMLSADDLVVVSRLIQDYKLDRDKFLNKFEIVLSIDE
jgi:hypothetical protein